MVAHGCFPYGQRVVLLLAASLLLHRQLDTLVRRILVRLLAMVLIAAAACM